MSNKINDWSDSITVELLEDSMARRKITVACYYRDGERRTIVWYPFNKELVVSVNGVKTTFDECQRQVAIERFKRGLKNG